jgi:pimeloyl-ACP methyl ester carboxylesterase
MIARSLYKFRRRLLDRFVLEPSRDKIDYGSQRRELLTVLGRTLETFVQFNFDFAGGDRAEDAVELLVLKFPGTAGRAERSTEFPMALLPDVRVAMWTWNPPGYGGSGGRATMDSIAEAAVGFGQQVIERVANPSTRIWLCANSLGCATALHVASSLSTPHQFGMICRNPPPLIPVFKRIADRYPLGRWAHSIAECLPAEMNATLSARQVDWPSVFLVSELDTLVPPDLQQQIIDAYAGPRQVVCLAGLSHGGVPTDDHEPHIQQAIDWLWQQM